ncbi:hypothetical protein BXZ70DRAFT_423126 [Cristinia sonorae]|uniref:Uncharacterized protein n=1 Tax=Cristinia sonorae TaxID=1940300 RepID=A0A8K0UWQ3_9AGAR|nr:hypothetical protein BXZ70DRAFT_423126 [Cristinia sonorae]
MPQSSQKLFSGGADCTVNLWDFESERNISMFKTSNSVFQAHSVASESCVLLEVAHRELQFELRDIRMAPNGVAQRFGYHTAKFHGRHWKGDISSTRFASGSHDGAVRVWDVRKADRPYSTTTCFPGRRIFQVAFNRSQLLAYSEDHHLAFSDP